MSADASEPGSDQPPLRLPPLPVACAEDQVEILVGGGAVRSARQAEWDVGVPACGLDVAVGADARAAALCDTPRAAWRRPWWAGSRAGVRAGRRTCSV